MLRVFEAFSGVGSQRMALRNIGVEHEVVAIAEIDKHALKSYEAIHGDCPNLGDISKLTISEIPDHDLFTYSFPCQDISVAGKVKGLQEGSGTRSSLLWECKRIIEGKKPKYLLLENVKNLVGKKNKPDFDRWLQWLESQGYTNYWKVVNAKHQGIPQNRERVFCVSVLGNHKPFKFPEEKPLEILLKDILEEDVDEKFYLADEIVSKFIFNETKNTQPKILIKNATNKGYLEAEYGDGIDLNYPDSSTRRGRIQKGMSQTLTTSDSLGVLIYKGSIGESKWLEDGKNLSRNHRQGDRVYGSEGVASALISQGVGSYGGYSGLYQMKDFSIRKLTPRECWRLMGFTDYDFDKASKVNSNSQLYKQAGNSIVVNVLEGIFKNLFK